MTSTDPIAPHPTLRSFYDDDADRQRYINDLFDKGTRDYDLVNGLLSLGSGYWYRGEVLRRAGLGEGMRVLDVATGTGSVVSGARATVTTSGFVVALDPSAGMLRVARQKADAQFVQSVGEALPLRGETFHMLTMGYALRHVPDLRAAFQEYRRVLRVGGHLVIMEISMPRSRIARAFLRAYMGVIAPVVARLSTRSRDTARMMRYYWKTTETCVAPEVILDALRAAGFDEVHRDVKWGILS